MKILLFLHIFYCLRLLKLRGKENFIVRMNGKNELELYDYFSPKRRAAMIKNESLKDEVLRVIKESTVVIKQRVLFYLIHEDLYDVIMKHGDVTAIGYKSNKKYDKIIPNHEVLGFTRVKRRINRPIALLNKRDHSILAFSHEESTSPFPQLSFKTPGSSSSSTKKKDPVSPTAPKYKNMFKKSNKKEASPAPSVAPDDDSLNSAGLLPRRPLLRPPPAQIAPAADILTKTTETPFYGGGEKVEETTVQSNPFDPNGPVSVKKTVKTNAVPRHSTAGAFHIESDSSMEQEEQLLITHSYVTESGTRPFFNLSNTEGEANRLCLTFVRPSFIYAPCVDGMRNQHFTIVNEKEIIRDIKKMRKRSSFEDSEDESELLEKDFADEQSDNKSVTIKTVDENTGKESKVSVQSKKHVVDGPKIPETTKTTIISQPPPPPEKTIKKETVTETKKPAAQEQPKVTVTKKTSAPAPNLDSKDVAGAPDNFIEQLKNTFDEGEIKKLINI